MSNQSGVFLRNNMWRSVAALLCFFFGIAFILNVHPIGDGLWFWYGRAFREHRLLYTDLHLPLQPLFVMLTAWTQALFGMSWLASKILAVAQLATFCVGLWLVAGYVAWRDWQRALMVGAVFLMTLTSTYFRFDDYHVTGYLLLVFCIYGLLRLAEQVAAVPILGLCALLGVFSGLSLSNRLNDGAALWAGCFFSLLFAARRLRWAALIVFCAASAASFIFIILATGDSFSSWELYSIARAATIKGGTHSVLGGPLRLVATLGRILAYRKSTIDLLYVAACVYVLLRIAKLRREIPSERTTRIRLVWVLIASLPFLVWQSWHAGMDTTLAAWGAVFLVVATLWVLVNVARFLLGMSSRAKLSHDLPQKGWDWRETLLLLPFLQILSGALTSGSSALETYPAIALLLLVLPLAFNVYSRPGWRKAAVVTVAGVICISGPFSKTLYPYRWHHFVNHEMFLGREWYQHPLYGPVYIERDQARLAESFCATVEAGGQPRDMLSVTNPYINWFCGVPPWHDYVQSWYDTTSRQTIEMMDSELETRPPRWIVYERSLITLGFNELAFGAGRYLPHREFDSLVVRKLASGEWTLVKDEQLNEDDWLLIETVPSPHPVQLEQKFRTDLTL